MGPRQPVYKVHVQTGEPTLGSLVLKCKLRMKLVGVSMLSGTLGS